MSKDTDRQKMKEALSAYTLMRVSELAQFLGCSEQHVRDLLKAGRIPSVNVALGTRPEYRVPPLDAAVFMMAQRDGLTPEKYWELHGEATVDLARREISRIQRLLAA